jgi:hypothetical protein
VGDGSSLFPRGRRATTVVRFAERELQPEDYQNYAARIAQAIDAINHGLLNTAIAAHPEFAARIEADLETYGRVL